MKVMNWSTVAMLVAATLASPGAFAQDATSTLAKIQRSGVIAIGHRETSVPFSYVDANNEVVGFSQDLCNKVIDAVKAKTKRPDLKVRFIPVTSQNRIPLVQNGTVDLECGVTTNLVARQSQVAFADTFFVATTRLLTRKDSGIKDFPDLAGKTVVTNQGTTSERILRKMNEDKKMNMQIISAKDYGEGRLTLESGRAVAYMMDDVLLAGTRTLTAKPSDWIITGTPQSSEAYGFMLRRDDPEFRKLVDDTLEQVMKGPEIHTMYDRWFIKPVPPKNISFDFPMSDSLKQLYATPNDKALE
ncbi:MULTISPECIES: glutamate/aspartate ABC transporter substrate-binding protein [unclassified Paraburkholderia]|uniref:glutamate/aspartate ABC transporter substrate-binding protein n=1 Tax=unclassified Paraburkholderia TaxID=2615204 RepID=UPI0016089484|nr:MULTISPECIES: glutamate/aspartate ABC transporter substrate-binding protein [unclassified Paraburkholderia]MBB5458416.1 glutamate/aspartate transport system substrate-binding protein [Paraburkholderia sp. Cpub6]MBB5497857.1 glutamate/aspartate transport system substrate-binding protein [Paraburkholderia sp. MM5384-R2]MBC8726218.1 glutamate/aspartate ABC transporter substrate-binding protein [Paraburkholderia sp. 31.1]MBC8741553.1 glutamate/aspartate ABC transporter substrate-binding protein 